MKFAGLAALVCLALAGCRSAEQPSPEKGTRIGVYNSPALVVAWVRSAEHAAELQGLVAARDAAAKAGDEVRVAELEKHGAQRQDHVHRQLAGEEGTEDILERLERSGDLAAVREQARVAEIRPEGTVLGDQVELVDVTDLLVDRFHPDEATRQVIADLRRYPKGVRVH